METSKMRNALTVLTLLLAGVASPPVMPQTAPAAAVQSTSAKVVASDHPAKTPSGATFTAPEGWMQVDGPKRIEFTSPEGDLRLTLVDVEAAADAKAAAAAAWKAWAPVNARPPKLITARPARNGWDERRVVDYEISPNEKRAMWAIAYRSGKSWIVAIVDGNEGTAEKRLAAIGLVTQSLRPAGYKRESFAGKAAHPMDRARIAQLRAFVQQSMKELGIPGASFALTTRKNTIYSTGLGVRALGSSAPVDADSEFMIASNTKGMSTLLLAKLVDEGKLSWDEPVTQAYPAFRLGSPETTAQVQIRHLVCACTGLPRKDMEWLLNTSAGTPASDTFVQLAATEPTSKFGEVFQYNNLMAAAAGYLGGHLVYPDVELGQAYDRAMQELVFGPLGMTATTFDYAQAMAKDWAEPHSDGIDGKPAVLGESGLAFNLSIRPFRPAGGAWSTANDLIKYVRFELNEGRLDNGTQYVSTKNLLQRRVPNVPVGEDRIYGMGLQVDRDYGVDVVHHGGSMAGFKSDLMLIPSADIGAVVLTSADNGWMLLRPFMRRLLELVYDGKPEAAGDVAAAAARSKAELATERARVSVVPEATALAALAPEYFSPDLGPLKVTRRGAGVTFTFRSISSAMGTRKNDDGTISFVSIDPLLLFFPLVVGQEGGKPALIVRDGQHEYKFVGTE
jgi:CubicO group peptidase (beta-lactamase class C family)